MLTPTLTPTPTPTLTLTLAHPDGHSTHRPTSRTVAGAPILKLSASAITAAVALRPFANGLSASISVGSLDATDLSTPHAHLSTVLS